MSRSPQNKAHNRIGQRQTTPGQKRGKFEPHGIRKRGQTKCHLIQEHLSLGARSAPLPASLPYTGLRGPGVFVTLGTSSPGGPNCSRSCAVVQFRPCVPSPRPGGSRPGNGTPVRIWSPGAPGGRGWASGGGIFGSPQVEMGALPFTCRAVSSISRPLSSAVPPNTGRRTLPP